MHWHASPVYQIELIRSIEQQKAELRENSIIEVSSQCQCHLSFQVDEKLIDQFISDKVAEINGEIHTDVELAYEALEQFWKIMAFENNGTTSRLVELFRLCASVETSAEHTISVSPFTTGAQPEETVITFTESSVRPSAHEFLSTDVDIGPETSIQSGTLNPSHTALPSDALENIITSIRMSTSMSTPEHHQEQSELSLSLESTSLNQCNESSKYTDDLVLTSTVQIQKEQKFFITAQEYSDSTDQAQLVQYKECFDLIDLGKKIIETFFSVQDLINKLPDCGLQECLVLMEELMAHHQNLHIPDSNEYFDSRLEIACRWRTEFAQRVREKTEMRKANIVKLQDQIFEANTFHFLWLAKLFDVVHIDIFSIDILVRYLSKNITKQEIAQQWLSPENLTERQNFLEGITDLENRKRHYDSLIPLISDLMIDGYYNLRNDRPAIINASSARHLELVKKGLTVKFLSDHAREGYYIINIALNFPIVLREGPIKIFETTVMKPLQDIREELKEFEMNLREYQDSIKMDTQFYL